MEDRKRTILAIIIACVVLLAVLYSFGLNLFNKPPQLELPDSEAVSSGAQGSANPEAGGIPVEVTPRTVQSVVASLSRYESYSRTVSITYEQDGAVLGTVTAQVWVDSGWTRTDATLSSGMVEHSIVGDGQLWLWYNSSTAVHTAPAGVGSADLTQRVPTYEEVLDLDPDGITRADYVQLDGQNCIYVEFEQEELGYLYRYWIAVDSGLLVAAETQADGDVVYSMTSRDMSSPITGSQDRFVLPDGTALRD